MPRLRLAARLLRGRSSSSARSCASCEAAAAGTSFSSSPLNPSSPVSRARVSSSALLSVEAEAEEKSFHRLLGFFPHQTASTSVLRERSSSLAHLSRPPGPSSIRDPHPGPIFGVKQRDVLLGQRSPGRSVSAAYSTSLEHDRQDGQQERAIPISSEWEKAVVDPSLQKCEEEEETEVVNDGVEAFSGLDDALAPGKKSGPATLLYEDEDEEVATRSDASLSTSSTDDEDDMGMRWDASLSTSSTDDESDLSGLEFVRMNGLTDHEGDGSQLEVGDSRSEVGASLERSREQDEGRSDLLSDFLDVVETADEDAREGGFWAEPGPHGEQHDEVPYLHTLSVDEVREVLEKARAKDVRVLQVNKCCEWVEHLVFASGRSSRHLRGMADAIVYKVKQLSENVGPNSFPLVEGRNGEQWMAIDCGSIVVHLFLEEARSYYNLEDFLTKKSDPRLVETF